jgi:hypothetical protein
MIGFPFHTLPRGWAHHGIERAALTLELCRVQKVYLTLAPPLTRYTLPPLAVRLPTRGEPRDPERKIRVLGIELNVTARCN